MGENSSLQHLETSENFPPSMGFEPDTLTVDSLHITARLRTQLRTTHNNHIFFLISSRYIRKYINYIRFIINSKFSFFWPMVSSWPWPLTYDPIWHKIRIQRCRLPLYTYIDRLYHVFGRRRLNGQYIFLIHFAIN
jgi:hypothetical protein